MGKSKVSKAKSKARAESSGEKRVYRRKPALLMADEYTDDQVIAWAQSHARTLQARIDQLTGAEWYKQEVAMAKAEGVEPYEADERRWNLNALRRLKVSIEESSKRWTTKVQGISNAAIVARCAVRFARAYVARPIVSQATLTRWLAEAQQELCDSYLDGTLRLPLEPPDLGSALTGGPQSLLATACRTYYALGRSLVMDPEPTLATSGPLRTRMVAHIRAEIERSEPAENMPNRANR